MEAWLLGQDNRLLIWLPNHPRAFMMCQTKLIEQPREQNGKEPGNYLRNLPSQCSPQQLWLLWNKSAQMKAACAFAVQKLSLPGLQAKGPGTDFLQDGCALSVNIWENPGHCSQVLWVDAKVEEQQGQRKAALAGAATSWVPPGSAGMEGTGLVPHTLPCRWSVHHVREAAQKLPPFKSPPPSVNLPGLWWSTRGVKEQHRRFATPSS